MTKTKMEVNSVERSKRSASSILSRKSTGNMKSKGVQSEVSSVCTKPKRRRRLIFDTTLKTPTSKNVSLSDSSLHCKKLSETFTNLTPPIIFTRLRTRLSAPTMAKSNIVTRSTTKKQLMRQINQNNTENRISKTNKKSTKVLKSNLVNSLIDKNNQTVKNISKIMKNKSNIFENLKIKNPIDQPKPHRKLDGPVKWFKQELYSYLEKILILKYPNEKRNLSEEIVLNMYNAVTDKTKKDLERNLQSLKGKLIDYGICKTQLDYFTFLCRFTPLEFIKKVVPMGRAYANEQFKHKPVTVSNSLK